MNLREQWDGLCDQFGEGIMFFVGLVVIFVLVWLYCGFRTGFY
jgi:hypothetical protein